MSALAHPLVAELLHQEQRRCEDEHALATERLHREERRVGFAGAAGHHDLRATTILQMFLDRGGCLLLEGEGGDFGSREGLGGNPVK